MKKALILSLIIIVAQRITAQELPRAAAFGVMIGNLSDSLQFALQLPSAQGTLIQKVFDGYSAHKAGLVANDFIVSLDGETIENTQAFLRMLHRYHGGDVVTMSYYRDAKLRTKKMVLQPKPLETSDDFDVIYSSVRSGENHLRTIMTRPKAEGKYPAVLLVGGVGCYSIDNPYGVNLLSMKMWVDSLTTHGYVTMRVEKTGMGDSEGTPCESCDFHTEKQGFLDGLKQLKSLPYVDPENVFIAGFSMGGVIAPLIAEVEPVKGIIVYGTVGRNWFEYELENSHRQRLLDEIPADSLDIRMRAEYTRLYGLFVEKKSPEQVVSEHPETANNFFKYPMSITYFQQVSEVDIRTMWMNTEASVLAMHGSSDFVSSADEHALIAATVNRKTPGRAIHQEIPNADHWEILAKTAKISQQHTEKDLNPMAVDIAVQWIADHLDS